MGAEQTSSQQRQHPQGNAPVGPGRPSHMPHGNPPAATGVFADGMLCNVASTSLLASCSHVIPFKRVHSRPSYIRTGASDCLQPVQSCAILKLSVLTVEESELLLHLSAKRCQSVMLIYAA